MNKYVCVFLFTPERDKVLLKDLDGKLVPLCIKREEGRFAGDVGFGAVKAAGINEVKRLFYVESLNVPDRDAHVAVYAGVAEEGNIAWKDDRSYLFRVADILHPSTTLTGTGYWRYSGFDPHRNFTDGMTVRLLNRARDVLEPNSRYVVA